MPYNPKIPIPILVDLYRFVCPNPFVSDIKSKRVADTISSAASSFQGIFILLVLLFPHSFTVPCCCRDGHAPTMGLYFSEQRESVQYFGWVQIEKV